MERGRYGIQVWKWYGVIGAILVLCTLTVATAAIHADRATPWYAATPANAATASPSNPAQAAPDSSLRGATSLSKAFRDAASQVLPSVVMITNTPAVARQSEERGPKPPTGDNEPQMPFGFKGTPFGDLFKNPEFRHFFKEFPSLPTPDMPGHGIAGAGSGLIVDASGVILTNNHVVAGGGQVMVRLHDGREFKAVDIKTDPKSDLAVLRIKGAGPLPAARLGDSAAKVDVGDWVLALGEPFGLEGTVTAGIISAKGRGIGITDREDFLQTDAAINPGNSGGPLVNLNGEVIGINTAISSSSGGYQGVGFAIPIDLARWVGGELVQYGQVHRAYLGVIIQPVTQPLAEQFKAKVHEGVLVTEVQPNTPAAKAGLQSGDIILQFAGKPVSGPRELQGMVEEVKTGTARPLTILRGGKRMTLDVVCMEQPRTFSVAQSEPQNSTKAESSRFEKLGIQIEDLTPQIAEQLGIKADHGVVITDVQSGSPAEMAGLGTGMVITEANRQPVKSVDAFRRALGGKSLEKGLLLLVRTTEGSRFVVIRVESE